MCWWVINMDQCRILIVEDELISRQAFRYILGMDPENFEIVGEALNGRDGLEQLEQLRPHVVISDVIMPVMNGIEFARLAKLRLPEVYTIILSGHSDFEYVKSAFQGGAADYILKSQLEPELLLEKLYQIMEKLGLQPSRHVSAEPGSWLLAAVEGGNVSPPAALPNRHVLLGCSLHKIGASALSGTQHAAALIHRRAEELLGAFSVTCTVTRDELLLLLVSSGEAAADEVTRACRALCAECVRSIPALFFALGVPFRSIHELPERYNRLRALCELRFYFGEQSMAPETELPQGRLHAEFDMKGFIQKLKCHDFVCACESLNRFMSSLGQGCYLREGELKKLLDSAVYTAVDALLEVSVNREKLYAKRMEFFSLIDKAKNIQELSAAVVELTGQLCRLAERDSDPLDNLRRQISAYMGANYGEPLTLNTLALHLHLSYSYLSSCWSRCFGCSFNEYLNSIRLEEAKRLLSATQIPVSEVSGMAGYSEQGYFSKVFKKHTGLSPLEYRRIKGGALHALK